MKGTDRVFLQQSRTSTKNSSNVTNEKINILKQRYGIEIITSTTEDKVDNVILLNDTPYNITAKQYSKDFFKKEKGFHLQTVKLLDTLSSNYIDFDFLNHWLNLWSLTPNGRMPNGKSTNYKSTIVNQENRNKANELIYFLMKYQALIYGNILKDMGTNISQIFMGFVEDTPYIYTVKDLMINPNVKWKFTPQLNQLNLMGYNKFVKGNKNDKIISLIHQRINKILSAIDTKTIQVTIDPTHLS